MKRILAVLILVSFPLLAMADPPTNFERSSAQDWLIDTIHNETAVSETEVSLLPIKVFLMVPVLATEECRESHSSREMRAYRKPEVGWRS